MRITNKRVLPPKRDPRTGDPIVWREASNERQEKPWIKVTSKDKPSEGAFRRPHSKIRGGSKRGTGLRVGATRTIVAEESREPRAPSHENNDPFRRAGSRSGKFNIADLTMMTKTAYKGRAFQLKKDKQLYEKVWQNREDEHKKNTPTKPIRINKEEIKEKTSGSEYKLNVRQTFYINEGRQKNSHATLNDISTGHQERRTLNIVDSNGASTQKQKSVQRNDQHEERQMFRIKSKQLVHHHTITHNINDDVKDTDTKPVVNELPSEQVVFEPFEGCEEELLTKIKSHLTNLSNPRLMHSQNCSEDYLKQCFCQPTWVRVWRSKKLMGQRQLDQQIIGMVIYQLDSSHFKTRRLLITHFSVQNYDHFEQYLKEAIDHIFRNDACTEIHMQFSYVMEDGKMVIYPELKDSVKKAGMKWRMVVNSADGSRICVFEAKRNTDMHPYALHEAACHEPLKQISFAMMSQCAILNERDMLRSDRMFRGRPRVTLVPYDRTFLTFAAFLRFIDYKCGDISADKLRNAGKYGELILNAKSKPV